MDTPGRRPAESDAIMSELMMPNHANSLGNIFGGVVLSLVDRVGAVAAMRHARRQCVTVSVDKVDFAQPVHVGELITAYARVNWAGRTSMEVGVKVCAEDVVTGRRHETNSCYVTYVAIDADGRPVAVPPVAPDGPDDERRFREAAERRAARTRPRKPRDPDPPDGADTDEGR
ncbi:MAG: acyl-CoA thioesterase [Deltaproteobacteria bacterium]|nr:acyl-CoA thioesterase [Deltaproteobacteria bacterium]